MHAVSLKATFARASNSPSLPILLDICLFYIHSGAQGLAELEKKIKSGRLNDVVAGYYRGGLPRLSLATCFCICGPKLH